MMVDEMEEVYKEERKGMHNSNDFLKLFKHIKNNQLFNFLNNFRTIFFIFVRLRIDKR